MSAHTPAPWTVGRTVPMAGGRELLVHIESDTHGEVARLMTYNEPDLVAKLAADVTLIAAAPDLLEAARLALGTLEALVGGAVEHPDIPRLRAAIAKAEGRR